VIQVDHFSPSIVDARLKGAYDPAQASYLFHIARACVAPYKRRSNMSEVLSALEKLAPGVSGSLKSYSMSMNEAQPEWALTTPSWRSDTSRSSSDVYSPTYGYTGSSSMSSGTRLAMTKILVGR
jgi:hypothetical protein